MILELTGWIISRTEIMSSNISDPFPKKSDNPSNNVRKKSGDLDENDKALITTTDTIVKERNTNTVDKKGKKSNVVKEAITPPI